MTPLTHLDLFSGIGGMSLAAEAAGIETVAFCEWADYPRAVLDKHWPDVPKWRDIRTLGREGFHESTGLRTVDIISGGFPCQPFSVAGKQKGKGDERYLWPEMLRVTRELAPRWVVGENVPGILRIAGRTVCEDLEREGYDIAVFNYEAAAVGAPHRRERIFFVANTNGRGLGNAGICKKQPGRAEAISTGEAMADTDNQRLQRRNSRVMQECACKRTPWTSDPSLADAKSAICDRIFKYSDPTGCAGFADSSWWSAEPDVGRVAHGISNRVDRLKCLGNAVVPAQVYPIFAAIAEIERMGRAE